MKYNINMQGLAEYIGDLKIKCSMEQKNEYQGKYYIAPKETEEGTLIQITMSPFVPLLKTFVSKEDFTVLVGFPDFISTIWVRKKEETNEEDQDFETTNINMLIGEPDEDIQEEKHEYEDELDNGVKSTFIKIPAMEFSITFKTNPKSFHEFISHRQKIQEILASSINDIINKKLQQLFVDFPEDSSDIYLIKTQEKIDEDDDLLPELDD